jgi:hypothetical protein
MPIVQVGTAYENPDSGETFNLINQALYLGDALPHTLLNRNQNVQPSPYTYHKTKLMQRIPFISLSMICEYH